ncbi:MAG TPA: aldehyde dehydrogenase [Deltaproteobacteria bacterium]|nr:aldehyde dehydrogenase [Deltaproteobacteria bacterium]
MEKATISDVVARQKVFFASGVTKDLDFRLQQLRKLHQVISDNERRILDALHTDLRKPTLEAYASEISLVFSEITYCVKKLRSWARPRMTLTALPLLPSRSFITYEPFGVALILSPWNYPFQLAIAPLIGAMAAGNCAIIKPSEISPATSSVMAEIFEENFDPRYISVITGGPEVAQALLEEQFDTIFFTGSTRIGRVVMEAASRHLTPVTLELGGKSPCIVDSDVNMVYAARRIAWAKFFNAGQTCVAPDYLLVDEKIMEEFLDILKRQVLKFFGTDPTKSPDYARIISEGHFSRLSAYLDQGDLVVGGQTDRAQRYIAPTIMRNAPQDAPVMHEEIFGPILPVLSYSGFSEAIRFVNSRPKPLSLYLFSRDLERQQQVIRETSSGGICFNDAMVHVASHFLPFGGVGESGMGSYHGRASFDAFSHTKSVVKNTLAFDIPLRYVPYRFKLQLVKWFF